MILQTIDDAQIRFVQAVVFIGFVFGDVDMKPGSIGRGSTASLKSGARERKTGVQAKRCAETRVRDQS